jgi:hypothetical protein
MLLFLRSIAGMKLYGRKVIQGKAFTRQLHMFSPEGATRFATQDQQGMGCVKAWM